MGTPTDPAFAAVAAAFPAGDFKAAIRFAMQMGMPNSTVDRTTFRWVTKAAASGPTDHRGRPLHWNQPAATPSSIDDLTLTCLSTQGRLGNDMTNIGNFDPSLLTVIMFDDEYETLVAHADGRLPDLVVAGGVPYADVVERLVLALFEVDVRTLEARTADVGAPAAP